MKVSEQWLREWVDPPVGSKELAEQLTMAGLEVDSIEPAAGEFASVVVGEVLEVAPHPDADKLRVCRVEAGQGEALQIVCGAPNVHQGMRAPVALVGGRLPGGLKIKKAKLRGVESFGMLCSARELGLSEEHAGLMALPADAPLGTDIRDYLKLDDRIIEVDLTPNRGDCLGMAGIAREVALLNDCELTPPAIAPITAQVEDSFPVAVDAPAACPRYLGRVIRGIDPAAVTPLWLQERLRRGGIRPLGPVIDVTNYVLLELGQPMHGFDLARLQGGIRVRFAEAGEKLTLLDGREVALAADTLVIADARQPLALAGVMGGEGSGVSDSTRDVFLECAFFDPLHIAGRARAYGLQTDSSYRFERGVDPELQLRALDRATQLLVDICGGRPGPVIEVCSDAHLPRRPAIRLRSERIRRLLGFELKAAEVAGILEGLGCAVDAEREDWSVIPPSHRFDLAIEADLIEELGRVHGYNRLPSRVPAGRLQMTPQREEQVPLNRLRLSLIERGYREAITYSFVDADLQRRLEPGRQPIPLANPISADLAVMRSSLWPGLLGALGHNLRRQQERVRLFESGLNFISEDNEIKQESYIAGVACGRPLPEQWGVADGNLDFFDAKADLEALLRLGGRFEAFTFEAAQHPALHPGRSARVLCDGRSVGWIGTLHPRHAEELELPADTQLFELEIAPVTTGRKAAFEPISRYPAIRRDLALLVDEAVPAAAVAERIRLAAGETLKELRLFDVYQGKGIETGRKSIALGLILQDSSRTLTDQDVQAVVDEVTTALQRDLGASLRE
ncbi:phenylalanine--tRNA ligase beta subunit [Thiohalobacter sp. COW1]|uniref:phenylalanine--tRNA ligase subunit beta n=1 Tax=Thiohalobacter sp. COW1 TaxID=2795687 RepID=UPI00191596DC|nr:phenylalanine--tRNA ligase subunit beta [Thiohalobacter sp. COW1]BCO30395.1 phenylalanine--tRNA ligase beta subunit [Thiohalobacter sp. COW1]